MRPITVTLSSAGVSDWQPVDYKQTPVNIGLGVVLSAGAVLNYTVEHTFDDVQDPSVTPSSFPNDGLKSQVDSEDGNYAFPVKAARLKISSYTSGSATLTILQGGQ